MPRASRPCPVSGCPNLIRFTRYCPEHTQAWSGPRTASSRVTSQRRWRELVPKILDRDRYLCRIQYEGICTGRATVVDRTITIVPTALRDNQCSPEQLEQDKDFLSKLMQVTSWRWEGVLLVLEGPEALRWRPASN